MTVREIAGFLLDQYKVVPSHALRGNGDHVKNGSGERVSVTSVTRNSNMITRFLATNPPSLLASAVRQAASVSIVGADFKKLKATFEEKRYLEAKDLLDELV
jgi:hypothetical protein